MVGELVEEPMPQPEGVREDVGHRAGDAPGFGEVTFYPQPKVGDPGPHVLGVVTVRVERELGKVGCRGAHVKRLEEVVHAASGLQPGRDGEALRFRRAVAAVDPLCRDEQALLVEFKAEEVIHGAREPGRHRVRDAEAKNLDETDLAACHIDRCRDRGFGGVGTVAHPRGDVDCWNVKGHASTLRTGSFAQIKRGFRFVQTAFLRRPPRPVCRYQPAVPGSPLKGPTTRCVIHPP